MNYLKRTVEAAIAKAAAERKVVMISGLRQVGKSTMLRSLCADGRAYVELKELTAAEAAADPGHFFESHPAPAVIDEMQLAPALIPALADSVGKNDAAGQYLIGASQRGDLPEAAAAALGRDIAHFELLPLSVWEQCGWGDRQVRYLPGPEVWEPRLFRRGVLDTWESVWEGGLPAARTQDCEERTRGLDAMIDAWIDRDAAGLTRIDKRVGFRKFLRALAFHSGQALNFASIGATAGISPETIRRWYPIAEATGLVKVLPAFPGEVGKRLQKTPRYFMVDTGLIAHLLGIASPVEMARHAMAPNFLKTFFVIELMKSWLHTGAVPKFSYMRDNKGFEVDLVIENEGKCHCVALTTSRKPADPEVRCLKWLIESGKLPLGMCAVIGLTDEPYMVSDNVVAHSIWDI
ncbi:ATP-binding protein [Sutterella sp.]|uniref:ATP-binding protein n=1 Tax=Sutterella sp. TaxID=1981025 RepID=UPI0026DF077D|nr:DUF4143 domain-containing protein [Sutterella sp.]MDO5532977.1 AAA family ATPase [Sutterella sp.]